MMYSGEEKFPPNYQVQKDEVYLSAVQKDTKISWKDGRSDSVINGESILNLSYVLDDINIQDNYVNSLAHHLYNNRTGGDDFDKFYLPVIEAFGNLGAFVVPLDDEGGSFFFVLPPYLSLHWGDLFKSQFLGENLMASITVTDPTMSLEKWKGGLGKFVDQKVVDKLREDKLGELNESIGNILNSIKNKDSRAAFVGIFANLLIEDNGKMIVPNVFYYISKMIKTSYVKDVPTRLPVTTKLTRNLKKIMEDNKRKLKGSESLYTDDIIALYVIPLPYTVDPVEFVSDYPPKSSEKGFFSSDAIPMKLKNFQKCAEQECLNPDNKVSGFFDFHEKAQSREFLKESKSEWDCSDPNTLSFIKKNMDMFGINVGAGKIDSDTCKRVSKILEERGNM